MPPALIRVVAATLQVGLGLLAVLGAGWTASQLGDFDVHPRRALLVAVTLVLGVSMFAVWVAARNSRRWLRLLGMLAALLAILTTAVSVHQIRLVRGTPNGLWTGVWMPVVDAVVWLLIALATVVELRQLRRLGDVPPRGWPYAVAVAAPLALVVALPVLAVAKGPATMIRLNSEVSAAKAAGPAERSALTGRLRWETRVSTIGDPVATRSGLAVPVAGDADESAGVVMLDPGTGATLWRYQLRGLERLGQMATTDDGRGLVLTVNGQNSDGGVPQQTFTLDAATGQVRAFWPDSAEVGNTDPPVLFDHVPQGANSVIAISPTGKRLWRYRPERCADPRGVQSTPSVMVVYARQCGPDRSLQVLGLDARTGKRRWTQPATSGDDESGPPTVLLDTNHRLELSRDSLRSRQLNTGAVSWTSQTGDFCTGRSSRSVRRSLVTASQTAFLGCEVQTNGGPNTLTAYSTASGSRLWQRDGLPRIRSLAPVDDRRSLLLTTGNKTCDLQLVSEAGNTKLWSVPDDGASRSTANTDCEDSQVVRAGDAFVLVLQLRGVGQRVSGSYRIVGLS